MNYNSVNEIISAGTSNMTTIFNGNLYDYSTKSMDGASWLTYNNNIVSTVYTRGDSTFGFGSNSSHLKVNDRGLGKACYIYREEGTLYNYYNFLKFRWFGYTTSGSSTSTSYRLIYDVILWDTGDISLYVSKMPSSRYSNGTYSLTDENGTYRYTVSSSEPHVTFKKTDTGFNVENELINLLPPQRYLIEKENKYYTIAENILTQLDVTELTSEIFITYGIEDLLSNLSILKEMNDFKLHYWIAVINETFTKSLIIEGTPQLPQVIYYQNQIIEENKQIEQIKIFSSEDTLFSISLDDGQTWKYYDLTTETWIEAKDNEGMLISTIDVMTPEQWAAAEITTSLKFKGVLPTIDSFTSPIYIKYID